MLTFCSFLRSRYHGVKKGFVNMTKKIYHNSAIVMMGIIVAALMTFAFGLFSGSRTSGMTAYAETPFEATEEVALLTEAKIPFQLTEIASKEEGQLLVGDTLAQEMFRQQTLRMEQQEMINQAKEEIRQIEEEQERLAAEEAARKAAEEARSAAAITNYSQKDYEVLKRIVQAESGGCDVKGRILIANVIFNRMRSDQFPDTITEVVYQKSQFSPVYDGSLNKCTVTDLTVEAVNRALAGEDYSQGALYFMNRRLSRDHNVSWFDRELTYLFEYDRHEFFK